jgi:hypothetical protein
MSTTNHYKSKRASIQLVATHGDDLGRDQTPGYRTAIDGKTLLTVELAADVTADREWVAGIEIERLFESHGDALTGMEIDDLDVDEIDLLPMIPGKFFAWVNWSGNLRGDEPPSVEDPRYTTELGIRVRKTDGDEHRPGLR